MSGRYAKGDGEPPRYVSQFQTRGKGGVIVVEGGGRPPEEIPYRDPADLVVQCRDLIQRRIAFSAGGHVMGTADELAIWQNEGNMADTFTMISWRGPGQWLLYEVLPGGKPPWRLVEPQELVDWPLKSP